MAVAAAVTGLNIVACRGTRYRLAAFGACALCFAAFNRPFRYAVSLCGNNDCFGVSAIDARNDLFAVLRAGGSLRDDAVVISMLARGGNDITLILIAANGADVCCVSVSSAGGRRNGRFVAVRSEIAVFVTADIANGFLCAGCSAADMTRSSVNVRLIGMSVVMLADIEVIRIMLAVAVDMRYFIVVSDCGENFEALQLNAADGTFNALADAVDFARCGNSGYSDSAVSESGYSLIDYITAALADAALCSLALA